MAAILHRQPNWLSQAIGDHRDVDVLIRAISEDEQFRAIVKGATEFAEKTVDWCNEKQIPAEHGHYVAMVIISQLRQLYPDLLFTSDGNIQGKRAAGGTES